jgi:hypothetical protein
MDQKNMLGTKKRHDRNLGVKIDQFHSARRGFHSVIAI